jgi:cytochrome b pre-mRNA-processing protein 3
MILNRLFRKGPSPERRLYEAIVAAARRPLPYAKWGVPDNIDGRFDMVALHLFLVLDRLKGEAEAFRQRLVDEFFQDMDRSLREMGVGDLSVGKKVRKMAEAFYGRVGAYSEGMAEGQDKLAAALERNVYPDGGAPGTAEKLASYTLAAKASLAGQNSQSLVAGVIEFPEPQA